MKRGRKACTWMFHVILFFYGPSILFQRQQTALCFIRSATIGRRAKPCFQMMLEGREKKISFTPPGALLRRWLPGASPLSLLQYPHHLFSLPRNTAARRQEPRFLAARCQDPHSPSVFPSGLLAPRVTTGLRHPNKLRRDILLHEQRLTGGS
jgi:hypothetical protein